MVVETKITVRYAETDQMGIVHHSVYPIWFEAARTDFFKQAGFSYKQIEDRGFYLPLSELSCKYTSPAFYGDDVIIKTHISKITFVKLFFEYDVSDSKSGRPLAKGETVHAWTDKEYRPVPIKKCAPEIYEIIRSLAGSGD